jgi:hypothetical protein
MEIPFNIKIQKAIITVTPHELGATKAFAEVCFVDERAQTVMKVRGITIKQKKFSERIVLGVDFPAFRSSTSKGGFATSFILEEKPLWRYLIDSILEEYRHLTGDDTSSMYLNETVNPNEIPI